MIRHARAPGMLTHDQVWGALDRLAARAGLSPSGLARRAGLDPTTFNKSKRITPDGRARWPSTESIAKALTATGSSLDLFVELIGDGATQGEASVPLIGFGLAANGGYFDELGFPSGKGWNEVVLPWAEDGRVYALEISGDSMHPAYRDGDIIVVSPGTAIRRGDRVVVKTRTGEVMVKQFKRRTARTIELQPLNPVRAERTLAAAEVAWIARIIWASQ